ncbi:response regulator [Horticoccus luteus]|uniref:Response regulator n=1 Tax=Horticoccus luteus TaxID=2862869 RepID=A0A8F9TY51_9BACT|nr:response regulator [Horticoccus luteus]QYM80151.1 response regulator [Horticoccus luteus]
MSIEAKKAVVIVDDERSYTQLLADLIRENLTCPVFAYTSPLEALAALPAIDAAVIVTDYFMPQLNGLAFIAQARAIHPATPFIMITGNLDLLCVDTLSRVAGLKIVLPKPFGVRQLASEIVRFWPAGEPVPVIEAARQN